MDPQPLQSDPLDVIPLLSTPLQNSTKQAELTLLAGLGIALNFLMPPLGLLVSILAYILSKKNKTRSWLALVGIIMGAIITSLFVGVIVVFFIAFSTPG
jgi:hypothetical protein